MQRHSFFHPQWNRGFTLIEIPTVIAFILIPIAIALPNFLDAQMPARVTRRKARCAACTSQWTPIAWTGRCIRRNTSAAKAGKVLGWE